MDVHFIARDQAGNLGEAYPRVGGGAGASPTPATNDPGPVTNPATRFAIDPGLDPVADAIEGAFLWAKPGTPAFHDENVFVLPSFVATATQVLRLGSVELFFSKEAFLSPRSGCRKSATVPWPPRSPSR